MKDVEMFCRLERYTGSRDGEEAAERIAERMEELGIPVEREKYQVYRSLPGAAYLWVLEDGTGEAVPLTPYVYSGTAKDLEAELVFDRTSAAGGCSQREQRARMAGFSGKLVLTYENSFSFACEAKRAGALGVLTIWHADLAHHGTLGNAGAGGSVLALSRDPVRGDREKRWGGAAKTAGVRSADRAPQH